MPRPRYSFLFIFMLVLSCFVIPMTKPQERVTKQQYLIEQLAQGNWSAELMMEYLNMLGQQDEDYFSLEQPVPLFVVNGQPVNKAAALQAERKLGTDVLKSLPPNAITHAKMLEGEQAIAKYGQAAANGAVEITSQPIEPTVG